MICEERKLANPEQFSALFGALSICRRQWFGFKAIYLELVHREGVAFSLLLMSSMLKENQNTNKLNGLLIGARRILAHPLAGRVLFATAGFSGSMALILATAMQFNLLPEEMAATNQSEIVASEATEPLMDVTADLESSDSMLANTTDTTGLLEESTPSETLSSKKTDSKATADSKTKKKKASSKAVANKKEARASLSEPQSNNEEADVALVSDLGNMTAEEQQNALNEETAHLGEAIPNFDREKILDDYQARISDEFNIPKGLRGRVGFWFDVYTKYDSNRRVIHHSRYPWIVYKVVDVTSIINAKKPSRRWMRNEKADKHVRSEMDLIRKAIQTVSKKKALDKLNPYEKIVAEALSKLGGSVQKNARQALNDVRVQTGQRNFFIEGLTLSPRYLGAMEKIFISHRLPVELTRLPFVESSFNKYATSKVGATGVWQFMGNTGRKFMIVNDNIDERRSPFKATEAAARLLKENHMILHRSWPLAITAWNHGPGGVRRAMKAAGSREIDKIVANYRSKSFDFASSNFYSEFLAALYAEKYNDQIYGQFEREKPFNLRVLKLSRTVKASKIIKITGLSIEQFLLMNPDLKKVVQNKLSIPAGFKLHLPEQVHQSLERLLAQGETPKKRKSLAASNESNG